MASVVSVLSEIEGPADLRGLSRRSLDRLAGEIRREIVAVVARNGGHLASNLGAVELTIALHRVFDSPRDKIVWDVGHQCYAHKLLTGRRGAFARLRLPGGLAGFPKRDESPHDAFNTGHASTSISAALGILAAGRLSGGCGNGGNGGNGGGNGGESRTGGENRSGGESRRRVIAVIGDGALTGGLAYEALSHAGHLGLPLIVVLNDNNMSISPNVGAISKYLSRLSMHAGYQSFRRHFDALAQRIPLVGGVFFDWVVRLKRAVKAVFYTDNFFVDLGFDYVGPIDGHNVRLLERVLQDAGRLGRPVVVHAITRKGKGYAFAEDDPGGYHGVGAFSVTDGITAEPAPAALPAEALPATLQPSTFTDAFAEAILAAAGRDRRIVALTAAMEKGTGLSLFRKAFPRRFFDVGIAEAHAVTFAAGLASQGRRPVVAVYSTFMQRAVDQVIHDVALQNLPVVFALDRAGFVDGDGETHQGLFDLALFRAVPGITILAPAGACELGLMLDYALRLDGPAVIRYPKAPCPREIAGTAEPLVPGRGVWIARREGSRVCIAFTGSLCREALEAAGILEREGIAADLYNLRFLKPVDEDHLAWLLDSYDAVFFAEENLRPGGFGEYASTLAAERGCRAVTKVLAAPESFAERDGAVGTRPGLLAAAGLDGTGIAAAVRGA